MESTPKLSRDEFIQRMREKMEEALGRGRRRDQRGTAGADHLGERRTGPRPVRGPAPASLSRPACRCEWMRRKPLFPPPKDRTTGKTKRNKGRQDFTVLTINGRVRLWRRRWHSPGEGTSTPLDCVARHRGGRRSAWACGRWPVGSTATARTSTRRPSTWRAPPRSSSAARHSGCWSKPRASGCCRRSGRVNSRSIGRRRIVGSIPRRRRPRHASTWGATGSWCRW